MKNSAKAATSVRAHTHKINREPKKPHWSQVPVTREQALAYGPIHWRPVSSRERQIVALQRDHFRRSLRARIAHLTRQLNAISLPLHRRS